MSDFERESRAMVAAKSLLAAWPSEGEVPAWKQAEERGRVAARAARSRAAVKATGLPERLVRLVAAGALRETDAVAAMREPAGITVLSGAPGCGKTVAAASWLFDWAAHHLEAGLWLTAARLQRWDRYSRAEMDRLFGYPRLVLDDLGTEYLDERGSFMTTLDELVNERYASGRPLVITTNLNVEAFKQRYGERIADRIREAGVFKAVGSQSMRAAR